MEERGGVGGHKGSKEALRLRNWNKRGPKEEREGRERPASRGARPTEEDA